MLMPRPPSPPQWLATLAAALLSFVLSLPALAQPAPSAAATAALPAADAVAAAERHFVAAEYSEGLRVLNLAARHARRNHVDYARVLMTLARFYEQYTGDHRRVAGHLREVRRLKLPKDNPQLVAARQLQQKLDELAAKYKAEDELLSRVKRYKTDRGILEQRVAELTRLVETRPDYPRLAAAYHYLGETRLQLDQYRLAYQAFKRAIELKPAIGFSLPAPVRKDRAFARWVRGDLSVAAWAVLGALLLLAALLFCRSRAWRTMTLRHGVVLLALLGGWWLFFRGALWWLGSRVTTFPEGLPQPVYLHTAMGSPMSQQIDTLFLYGLVGVVGAFVLSVGAARLRPRWTWAFANAAAVMVLCASLMTQFYLRHGQALVGPAPEGRYPYLQGALYYSLTANQEPFMLTDPLAHCGFQQTIQEMDEPQVAKWFRRYADLCPKVPLPH